MLEREYPALEVKFQARISKIMKDVLQRVLNEKIFVVDLKSNNNTVTGQ